MSDLYTQIVKDLPNFPEDIINQWIGYYAEHDGWPPARHPDEIPRGRWLTLLLRKTLSYWQRVKWQEKSINLNKIKLEPAQERIIKQIINTHTLGQENSYSIHMGAEGKSRFNDILSYIVKNGNLPRMPVLIYDNKHYEIADGMHRIAAYILYSRPSYSLIKGNYLKNILINSVVANEEISVWVGCPTN